jgi:hypothetical protein
MADTTVASWCKTCKLNDGNIDPVSRMSLVDANIAATGSFDYIALAFSALTVAFTVVGELKVRHMRTRHLLVPHQVYCAYPMIGSDDRSQDIMLCAFAVAHAGDKLHTGWRIALTFVGGIRRWVFLLALVMAVPVLVMFKVGDGERTHYHFLVQIKNNVERFRVLLLHT